MLIPKKKEKEHIKIYQTVHDKSHSRALEFQTLHDKSHSRLLEWPAWEYLLMTIDSSVLYPCFTLNIIKYTLRIRYAPPARELFSETQWRSRILERPANASNDSLFSQTPVSNEHGSTLIFVLIESCTDPIRFVGNSEDFVKNFLLNYASSSTVCVYGSQLHLYAWQ